MGLWGCGAMEPWGHGAIGAIGAIGAVRGRPGPSGAIGAINGPNWVHRGHTGAIRGRWPQMYFSPAGIVSCVEIYFEKLN